MKCSSNFQDDSCFLCSPNSLILCTVLFFLTKDSHKTAAHAIVAVFTAETFVFYLTFVNVFDGMAERVKLEKLDC